ncbi:MAG: Ca-activated chloride channel family protein [Cryomorphaceae bacterium]|jgi:Ca-activated chloride channel family protein
MSFHFIRPMWLLALIPIALILYALIRQKDAHRIWQGVIAQHLLPFLVSDSSTASKGLRPHLLLGAVLVIATAALAGPSWNREPAPFADDSAALVIVIEVTPTMLAQDIQPSRLARATQKIRDLLQQRQGSATALVAYSGSAHLVMPLTEDSDLIGQFAAELDPGMMPVEGDAADKAIILAQQQLIDSGRAGSVLLITDGVSHGAIKRIRSHQTAALPVVHIFGVGTGAAGIAPADGPPASPLNMDSLEDAADAGRGSLVTISPDAKDIEKLAKTVETQFTVAVAADGNQRWKDAGYWFTPLVALLALVWFRPGWTVQWNAAAITVTCLLFLSPQANAGKSKPVNLFSTQDQSAQRLFDAGEYAKAAELFTDPDHQGTAWFKAGEFEKAAGAFGRSDTADGLYNRGNALIMLGTYDSAIKSYEAALKKRPEWKEAKANLKLAKLRLTRLKNLGDAEDRKSNSQDEGADDIVFDDRAKNQENASDEVIAGTGDKLSDAALRAQWLRQVQTKPSQYLRLKFLYQYKISQMKMENGKEAAK